MNSTLRELLREHGLPVEDEKPPDLKVPTPLCCGAVMEDVHGYATCYTCGHAVYDPVRLWYPTYSRAGLRNNDGCEFKRKRFYKKQFHFRTHLNRFTDTTPMIEYPWMASIRKMDINDRDLYDKVRDFLRLNGLQKHYSNIFRIIYHCGGVRPKNMPSHRIKQSIDFFVHYFLTRYDFQKTSMHCTPSMLQKIIELHCPVYYNLHRLKCEILRERSEKFWWEYIACDNARVKKERLWRK